MLNSRRSFLRGGLGIASLAAFPSGSTLLGCSSGASTAVSPPNSPSTPTISPKKGLAGAAPAASGLVTSWYYDWGFAAATSGMPLVAPSMPFYPMCWGWYGSTTIGKLADVGASRPGTLFGFNEPDNATQSNIPVATAIAAWSSLQHVATELVSPSCAHPQSTWFSTFMKGVQSQKLQLDAIGVHSYGGPDANAFILMLQNLHSQYGLPIWVTEFAVADWNATATSPNKYTVSQTMSFMTEVCAFMNQTSWIRGYAWFPTAGTATAPQLPLSTSVLFDANGNLTQLGQLYASL